MLYLSPVWHSLSPMYRGRFGYIQNLHNGGVGQGIVAGYPWMLDNGAFTDKWTEAAWLGALERWQPYTATCIAAVCPDVVGDSAATLARFDVYEPVIRQYGYPVAFVTQDGLTMDALPWDRFEVLFVGGTDKHKMQESYPFIEEAKRRNKWVHVGRVNSISRMRRFFMADSCDGIHLTLSPKMLHQRRYIEAAESCKGTKLTMPLFGDFVPDFTDWASEQDINPDDDGAYWQAVEAYRQEFGEVGL